MWRKRWILERWRCTRASKEDDMRVGRWTGERDNIDEVQHMVKEPSKSAKLEAIIRYVRGVWSWSFSLWRGFFLVAHFSYIPIMSINVLNVTFKSVEPAESRMFLYTVKHVLKSWCFNRSIKS